MRKGTHGLVHDAEELGFYPERMEGQGSEQAAGCHDLVYISARNGVVGLGSERQAWMKGKNLWRDPGERRWWQEAEG